MDSLDIVFYLFLYSLIDNMITCMLISALVLGRWSSVNEGKLFNRSREGKGIVRVSNSLQLLTVIMGASAMINDLNPLGRRQ